MNQTRRAIRIGCLAAFLLLALALMYATGTFAIGWFGQQVRSQVQIENQNSEPGFSSDESIHFNSQIDPDWTTGWNIPYKDQGEWQGQFTFTGPAVVEWWDQRGNGYEYEGYIILMSNESVTFPAKLNDLTFVGHWWKLENDQDAGRLMTTFRHLVFYGNTKTMDELRAIFSQETYGRFFGETQVPYKPQHIYMLEYDCNFWNQSECAQLDQKVRHLPVGITIDSN